MKKLFTVYNKNTKRVLFGGTADDPSVFNDENNSVLLGFAYETGWIELDKNIQLPEQPSEKHVFNYLTKQWEDPRTLSEIKSQQWLLVKAKRTEVESSGFTWNNLVFDSDAISQQRIAGAVQLALMNPLFSTNWTLADNTVRTLNQQQMLAVGMSLGEHITTVFTKGQTLRMSIDLATTKDAIEAIYW